MVEAVRDGVSPERAARALAELARGGAHHGLALEVLSGGPHWVRFATELADVMGVAEDNVTGASASSG